MNEKKNHVPTMYEAIPAVSVLNKVPGFEPLKLLRRTISEKTKEEVLKLDLRYKKLWFRLAHPNGRIRLKAMSITEQVAVFEAMVFLDRSDTEPISTYTAYCASEQIPGSNHVKEAQDEALDEALTAAGFGLQFADVTGGKAGERHGSEIPLHAGAPILPPETGISAEKESLTVKAAVTESLPVAAATKEKSSAKPATVRQSPVTADMESQLSRASAVSEQLPMAPAAAERVTVAPNAIEQLPVTPAVSEQLPVAPVTAERLPVSPNETWQLPVTPAVSGRLPVASIVEEKLPVVPAAAEQLPIAPATSRQQSVTPAMSEQQPMTPSAPEQLPVASTKVSQSQLDSSVVNQLPVQPAAAPHPETAAPNISHVMTAASGNNPASTPATTVQLSDYMRPAAGAGVPAEKNSAGTPVTVSAPAVTQDITSSATQPAYTADMPVEEIMQHMTLQEAQNTVVDVGTCNGWTMAQVAERRPPSLKWYVYGYKDKNNILRAAAQIMLNTLEAQKAG